jgi:hypothetical protein
VNLFLYDVQRSNQPSRSPVHRAAQGDGHGLRRHFQPMVQLGYLVSAWAGSPHDEHQLLGDVLSVLAGIETVPADLFPGELASSVHLSLGDDRNLAREVWSAAGGALKASFLVRATVAADTYDWQDEAPSVERIVGIASRM